MLDGCDSVSCELSCWRSFRNFLLFGIGPAGLTPLSVPIHATIKIRMQCGNNILTSSSAEGKLSIWFICSVLKMSTLFEMDFLNLLNWSPKLPLITQSRTLKLSEICSVKLFSCVESFKVILYSSKISRRNKLVWLSRSLLQSKSTKIFNSENPSSSFPVPLCFSWSSIIVCIFLQVSLVLHCSEFRVSILGYVVPECCPAPFVSTANVKYMVHIINKRILHVPLEQISSFLSTTYVVWGLDIFSVLSLFTGVGSLSRDALWPAGSIIHSPFGVKAQAWTTRFPPGPGGGTVTGRLWSVCLALEVFLVLGFSEKLVRLKNPGFPADMVSF